MKFYNLLLLLLIPAIAGCGQTGPLYLPNQAAPIHTNPEAAPKPEPKPENSK